ncbi:MULTISPECIES: hypothetical protein [Limnospira]|uniref:hypothetical protein n=1 Tax=Limnospira TaxID=2596745 RepID=UPI0012F9830E|nr:hypothetical protein [Limnospira indica]
MPISPIPSIIDFLFNAASPPFCPNPLTNFWRSPITVLFTHHGYTLDFLFNAASPPFCPNPLDKFLAIAYHDIFYSPWLYA